MDSMSVLIVVLALALLFDFSNGWHGAASAIATVSTRVLSPGRAVLFAGVLNVAGAFMSTAVAKMVGGEIVDPAAINQNAVGAAMIGALSWNFLTLFWGLPTSSSHALLGGMVGAAFAQGGLADIKVTGLLTVLQALLLSPLLGFLVGYVILVLIYWLAFRAPRGKANTAFRRLQLVSSSLMAFSHGSNDAQKVMGIITLALVSGGMLDRVEVPTWVIAACAVAMGLGTLIGGWRIIRTLGDADCQIGTGPRICRRATRPPYSRGGRNATLPKTNVFDTVKSADPASHSLSLPHQPVLS